MHVVKQLFVHGVGFGLRNSDCPPFSRVLNRRLLISLWSFSETPALTAAVPLKSARSLSVRNTLPTQMFVRLAFPVAYVDIQEELCLYMPAPQSLYMMQAVSASC